HFVLLSATFQTFHQHLLYLHSFPTRRSSDLISTTSGPLRAVNCSRTSGSARATVASSLRAPTGGIRSQMPSSGDSSIRPAEINRDRKSTRLNSSHVSISYAVFCLKKKNKFVL